MKHRFGTLDTMRGFAALAVVLFHLGQVRLTGYLAPHAYLAVDFFFVLSGFVIAYTYEAAIVGGTLSVPAFLTRRAIRLYPLAALGVGIAAAVMIFKLLVDPTKVDAPTRLAAGIVFNLFLLPDPLVGATSKGVLFPGNGAMWSVCLEALINVVWCLALVRAATSRLATLVGLCFVIFAATILHEGTANLGFDWATVPAGLARIGYGFGLGLLIGRHRSRFILTRNNGCKIAAVALLALTLLTPTLPGLDAGFDVLAAGLILPLVVLLGLNGRDHPRVDAPLGELSYPLYAIHFPILLAASGLHQKRPELGAVPLLVGVAVALAAGTWIALVAYDRPARRAMTRFWREGRGASPRPAARPAAARP